MSLRDVVEVFVAQDRGTGVFFDINMTPVRSLRHAARAENRQVVADSMQFAILEGQIECEEGYEIHSFFELPSFLP